MLKVLFCLQCVLIIAGAYGIAQYDDLPFFSLRKYAPVGTADLQCGAGFWPAYRQRGSAGSQLRCDFHLSDSTVDSVGP